MKILIGSFAILFLGSCSRFLETQRGEEKVIDLSDPQLACLQNITPVLGRIFDGTVMPSEIDASVACVEKSLDVFKKRYRGSMDKAYTAQDLNKFFNRYFFKSKPLTNSLTHSVLKLKAGLFGGDVNSVSQQEMDLFIEWFHVLKTPLLDISKDIPYLTFQTVSRTRVQELDHEMRLLRFEVFIQKALEKTVIWNSSYTLLDLEVLVKEGLEFVDLEDESRIAQRVKRFFPLIPALKAVLTGTDVPSGKEEKMEMLKSYIQVYGAALYAFHHKIFEKRLFGDLNSSTELLEMAQKFVLALKESPQIRKRGQIKIEYIDQAVEALIKARILGDRFEAKSSQEAVRKIFHKLFDSQYRLEGQDFTAVDRFHLVELEKEVLMFRSVVDLLRERAQIGSLSLVEFTEVLSDNSLRSKIQELFHPPEFPASEKESLLRDLQQVRKVMLTGKPTKYDSKLALQIDGKFYEVGYTSEALAQVVLIEGFSRLLTRGYGEPRNKPVYERSITLAKLNEWHTDFKDFGIKLLVFDPRSPNVNSRFYEANFFTYAGNGDEGMQYQETFEYLNFLFAAGISSAESLRTELLAQECHLLNTEGKTELDVFGQLKVRRECTRKVLREKFAELLPNLPGMVQHVGKKTDREFLEFFEFFEAATLGKSPELYDTGDLRTFVAVFHYVESLFTHFDENRSNTLELNEIRKASPRFAGLISKAMIHLFPTITSYVDFSPQHCRVRTTFEYLVVKGKKPSGGDTAWILSCWGPSSDSKADRDQIFKVLMELRSSIQ